MADDEKCVQVGLFVWKWHESVGWYDADEDDPTFGNEGVLLDEIVRLRAEVERKADYAERMDALAEERLIGWNAERALADQLAVALLGITSGRIIPTDDEWAGMVKMQVAALDAWESLRG